MLLKKLCRECRLFYLTGGCLLLAAVILLAVAGTASAAGKPTTLAEIALYRGPDREKILIEGAKKEGQLTFYDVHTGFRAVAQEFEKKYPFIKVAETRTDGKELFARVTEEYAAGRYLVDVINLTDLIVLLQREGLLQEYYSPHLAAYGDEYKSKGKAGGVYYMADLENYIGLGLNTEKIPKAEVPKSLKDLLDPKLKGKMSISVNTTGISWLGNALEVMGRDFIDKLSRQDVKVQSMSGAALLGLVASGEVPLSPTIFHDNVFAAKRKGAPVEWRPLEPVVTFVHSAAITVKAPHPHAAALFVDFLHSKEGQKAVIKAGPSSPRKDMDVAENFKKTIWLAKYTPAEYEKKYSEWDNLLRSVFMKGKK